ncbi:hypothetical protein TIFTF001_022490 [Ficus carica]|uniref:Uncharacterized protein n=1 Tax=Ficus carica TaxID=3494 RepID=A0AA88DCU5_FICCA|nr:hypothetical protein TIFTF001_022490 [Ficus carica]
MARLVTWNAEESAKFHNVRVGWRLRLRKKHNFNRTKLLNFPSMPKHPTSEDAPTMKLVFSHEWTLHFRTRAPLLLYNTRANTGGK